MRSSKADTAMSRWAGGASLQHFGASRVNSVCPGQEITSVPFLETGSSKKCRKCFLCESKLLKPNSQPGRSTRPLISAMRWLGRKRKASPPEWQAV